LGLLGLLAAAALTASAVAVLSGGGDQRPAKGQARRAAGSARRTGGAPRPSTAPSGVVSAPKRLQPSATATAAHTAAAGSLPQTHAFPSAQDPRFKALMASLWSGIVADSAKLALPAFFPKQAYVQLKAIASAESDWSGRLVRDYALDIAAAHSLLGPRASSTELVAVSVQSSYGHWVPPGVCSNGIGYYEMPGARIVYRQGGELRSFGIASMISWRGLWYVVHLGAVLRSGESGVVDEPASGAGTPAYSGTC
jgi:hypothetical protein